ncbi:hypothetical protein CMI48_02905 [Candidatus Pacearchaeota archaeon]|nr:hypothetical protein [Candidatus Pacearchaeota archaeon]
MEYQDIRLVKDDGSRIQVLASDEAFDGFFTDLSEAFSLIPEVYVSHSEGLQIRGSVYGKEGILALGHPLYGSEGPDFHVFFYGPVQGVRNALGSIQGSSEKHSAVYSGLRGSNGSCPHCGYQEGFPDREDLMREIHDLDGEEE